MRKFLQAILVIALFVATLGAGLKAEAAETYPAVTKITIKAESNNTKIAYTNGAAAVYNVTYEWKATSSLYNKENPLELRVIPADRNVANAGKLTIVKTDEVLNRKNVLTGYKTTAKLYVKGVNNGKKNIVLSAPFNKKNAKVSVQVKTWAQEIDNAKAVTVANGGTYNVGAKAIANVGTASDSKVKYSIADTSIATVNASGTVKGKKVGYTDLTIKSNDGKVVRTVGVDVVEAEVKSIANADTTLKKNTVNLVTNDNSKYTLDLTVKDTGDKSIGDRSVLAFKSSNTKVATVDANGVITAVANGTAKVTVTPALGNKVGKKVLTFTVKVTTKVDSITFTKAGNPFEILANNAKFDLGAKVNAAASNQKIKYAISNVKDAEGKDVVGSKNVKKYITVKNGVVQSKLPCTATITATAGTKDKDLTEAEIDVVSAAPVKSIAFAGKKPKSTLAATAYVPNTADEDDLNEYFVGDFFKEANLVITGPEDTYENLEFTSSDPSLADFDIDNKIRIKEARSGKVTLTAAATDGSGKKATLTLTVKVTADEINVDLPKDDDDATENTYVLNIPVNKKVNVASLINAKVNANASVQGVTYSVKEVKLTTAGDTAVITVTSKDTRAKTVNSPVSIKVIATAIAEPSTDYKVEIEEDPSFEELLAGDSTQLRAVVTANDQKEVVAQKIKWETDDKKIAKVDANGLVKALKSGTVTISATYGTETAKWTVNIGRSKAEVKKDLDNAFSTGLKEENRDYLGLKVKFDPKKALFTADITKPDADPAKEWEKTGLAQTIKELLPKSVYQIKLVDGDTTYTINRDGIGADVTVTGAETKNFTDIKDGIDYLREIVARDAATLKELNGKTLTVTVSSKETVGDEEFEYEPEYKMVFAINAKTFEGVVDKALNDVIDAAVASDVDNDVAEFAYNADKNVLTVEVIDETASLEELLNKTDALYAEGSAFFNTVAAAGNGVVGASVKVYADGTNIYNYIEELNGAPTVDTVDEYIARVSDKIAGKSLAAFEGKTLSIVKGYEIGDLFYTYAYTVEFNFGAKAYNHSVLAKIRSEFNTATIFPVANDVTVYLKANTDNAFWVDYKENSTFASLDTEKANALFNALTGDSRIKSVKFISVEGKEQTIAKADLSKYKTFNAITGKTADQYMNTVDGKTAYITVTYDNGTVLTYTVEFDKTAPKESIDDVSDNDAADVTPNEEVPAEDDDTEAVDDTADDAAEAEEDADASSNDAE